MEVSKRDIANQKLNTLPQHLVDEVIKYIDFLQFKSNGEDVALENALNKALQDVEDGKVTPHHEVMSSFRNKGSN